MKYAIEVKGKADEWRVFIPESAVADMRADGFTVLEVHNTIPAWVAALGYWPMRLWCWGQDAFDLPSRLWRKIRSKP